jgi:ParB-like chromosome segregation protein Spo0J
VTEQYQLFPLLDSATEAALKASIERWGVIVPVVKDQDGVILDGHHRARLADELGLDYPITRMVLEDEADRTAVVRTLNVDRRHLDPTQRAEIAASLRADGHSLRAIAGAVGVSQEQVRQDLSGVNHLTPESVVGRDGKRYPAKRPDPPPLEESMAKLNQAASGLDVLHAEQEQREAIQERIQRASSPEMNELRDACRRLLDALVIVEHLPAHEQTEAGDWFRQLSKELARHA